VTLVESVRLVGVVAGVLGALITAPAVTKGLASLLAQGGAAVVQCARRAGTWVLRPLPWYHQSQDLRPPGITGEANVGNANVVLTAEGEVWKPDDPVDERIEELRRRIERVSQRLANVREDLIGKIDEVRASLNAEIVRLDGEIEKLRARHVRAQQEAIQLDAAGVPVIGAAIPLTSLPDKWVGHWGSAALLFALVAAALLNAFVQRRRRSAR
jgi:hypothetical protein